MSLEEELVAAAEAARGFAEASEELVGVVPAEPSAGNRVFLCAYRNGPALAWLVLDGEGRPLGDRGLVRETTSIVAMCELAEESAGGGDVAELRSRLAELRGTANPDGVGEAEQAAAELESALEPEPRVARPGYLDAVGAAATRLERALGEAGGSPFAQAMKVGLGAVEELARDVEKGYKRPLG